MASVSVAPSSGVREPSGNTVAVDRLPEEMNDMKIRDDKVDFCPFLSFYFLICHIFVWSDSPEFFISAVIQEMEATVVDGNGTETGHIIVTTIGGRNGQPKQVPFAYKVFIFRIRSNNIG